MKIRSDFVSNSSSSSFIVSVKLDNNYKMSDFIQDIVDDCISQKDRDYTDDWVENLKEHNRRVLDYHLNFSELLFLGDLLVDTETQEFLKEKNEEKFLRVKNNIKDFGLYDGEKLIVDDDERIVISRELYAYDIVESLYEIYSINYYVIKDDCDISYDKILKSDKDNVCASILHYVKTYSDSLNKNWRLGRVSEIYKISKRTIFHTKILMENGYKVVLPKWAEDLDKLLERIDNGETIFAIRQNQGGDGMDERTIYALGGWESNINFNKKNYMTILDSMGE